MIITQLFCGSLFYTVNLWLPFFFFFFFFLGGGGGGGGGGGSGHGSPVVIILPHKSCIAHPFSL